MKSEVTLTLLAVVLVATATPSDIRGQAQQDTCLRCHRIIDEERYSRPVQEFREDIHAEKGFGCVSCHGGNSTLLGLAAKDPKWGYIGIPSREEIPELCGRCHSDPQFMKRYNPSLRVDQVAEYRTSVHGQRLFELGDPRVATCTDCHTAHSILPPNAPRASVHALNVPQTCGSCHADPEHMAEYPLPTDQLEEYKRSVHWQALSEGGDLSAPTCNDCHGNHGAAPPEISWVGNVCGQCHTAQADLFAISAHRESFIQLGTPGCAGCHGNHAVQPTSDQMLGLEEGSVCAECHAADESGGMAALAMRGLIDSLQTEMREADSLLVRAELAGVEVSQAQFELEDARNSLVRARTTTHSAVVDSVEAQIEAGLEISLKAWTRGEEAFDELRFRRLGLAASSAVIVILIAGLVVRIREREQKRATVGEQEKREEGSHD